MDVAAGTVAELVAACRVEPRPYQQRIVEKAVDLFTRQGLRSVLIDSPTGSGKTVMGLLIARVLQETLGVRTGWVAMRRNLLAQAAAENNHRGLGVQAEFVSMFDKDPPQNLDLLVVDEAQHDAASNMGRLHNLLRPRFILGLSATPFRADRVKLCFDKVLKDAGIHRLIQDGYLSPFHHYTLPSYGPEEVAAAYVHDRARWGKSLIYFHTLAACRRAEAVLRRHGVPCDVVTGQSDREAQIEAFKEGRLQVLLNCVVLAEGFDCPELQTVFCRPSCKSVTVQICGRVLRRYPGLPFKQVVQCLATRWPFPRTAAAAQQLRWVDGGWRTLQANRQVDDVCRRVRTVLARTEVKLPAWLTQAQSGQRRPWPRHGSDNGETQFGL